MRKIGQKLLVVIIAIIVLTEVITLVLAVSLFQNYNQSMLSNEAQTGVNVLKADINSELHRLNEIELSWSNTSTISEALQTANTAYISASWENTKQTDNDFCAIFDASGNTVWKSSNYALSSCDVSSVLAGNTLSGIFSDSAVELSLRYAAPLKDANGSIYGAAVFGMDMCEYGYLDEVVKKTSCQATIFSGDVRYATSVVNENGDRAVGTTMAANVKSTVIDNKSEYHGTASILNAPYFVCYEPMYDYNGNVVGAYFAGKPTTESDAEFFMVECTCIIAAVIIIVASILFCLVFTKKTITAPINEINQIADSMQKGELSKSDSTFKFSNDEIGALADKMHQTKAQLNIYIQDISAVLETMATGDFTKTAEVTYVGDFAKINQSFITIQQNLNEIIHNMNSSSEEVMSGASLMADGSQMLADGTTKQASAIQELSATIAEITQKIKDTADNAKKAHSLSANVEARMVSQNEEMANMLAAMRDIETKSNEISNIIQTIDDIAFQTNILSLNAAVEAARAGDAGKGFAVVADEVRNLASKSAEAAKNTTELISASIVAVSRGAQIANDTAATMQEVMEASKKTNTLINNITEATTEQASSIAQINEGVEQISNVVQQNSATAEETAASCEELSGQSTILKQQVAKFKV